jgi:hypothetical protein
VEVLCSCSTATGLNPVGGGALIRVGRRNVDDDRMRNAREAGLSPAPRR